MKRFIEGVLLLAQSIYARKEMVVELVLLIIALALMVRLLDRR